MRRAALLALAVALAACGVKAAPKPPRRAFEPADTRTPTATPAPTTGTTGNPGTSTPGLEPR